MIEDKQIRKRGQQKNPAEAGWVKAYAPSNSTAETGDDRMRKRKKRMSTEMRWNEKWACPWKKFLFSSMDSHCYSVSQSHSVAEKAYKMPKSAIGF